MVSACSHGACGRTLRHADKEGKKGGGKYYDWNCPKHDPDDDGENADGGMGSGSSSGGDGSAPMTGLMNQSASVKETRIQRSAHLMMPPQALPKKGWDGVKRADPRTITLPAHIEPFLREVLGSEDLLRKLRCTMCGSVGSNNNRRRLCEMHSQCQNCPMKTRHLASMSGQENVPWTESPRVIGTS